jgi:hypothetical protein
MYVPGVGEAQVPLSNEDRQEIGMRSDFQATLNRAKKYIQDTNNSGIGALTPSARAEGKILQSQLLQGQQDLVKSGRITEPLLKLWTANTPDLAGTHFTGKDMSKIDALSKLNNDRIQRFFTQKGIPKPQ